MPSVISGLQNCSINSQQGRNIIPHINHGLITQGAFITLSEKPNAIRIINSKMKKDF